MKVLYILLAILLAIIIGLSVHISITNHKSQNQKLWGSTDVIPDEETAEKVAYILLDKLFGLSEERGYDIHISFNEETYAWEVWYAPIPPEGFILLGGNQEIHIRKDNGAVIYAIIG